MVTALNGDGCAYGRGTRWGVGVILSVLAAVVAWVLAVVCDSRAASVSDLKLMDNRVRVVEMTTGRIDERLKSQNAQLTRIEKAVSQLADAPK